MWTTGSDLADAVLVIVGVVSVCVAFLTAAIGCGWLFERRDEKRSRFWLDLDDERIDFDDLV